MPTLTSRPLRADARDNRERIVAVAGEVFAEHGTGVSMTEIAKRADVGVATLFRRFPTKQALVDAVFSASVARWRRELSDALAEPRAWPALQRIIEAVAAEQTRHPACADMIVTSFLHGDGFRGERREVKRSFDVLIARAQAEGLAAADLEWADVALLLEANAGVVMARAGDGGAAVGAASARLVDRLLGAFRA
ncbi:TetR/AcrR family transcriptional regulator [Subtercola sp. YIM 133946]|uniref:TetR/AcrR family transcriptional regulator n=1 Tax=Subtercola sp. YIM 133946 TaxID=3118909 RepID=UPI002F942C27